MFPFGSKFGPQLNAHFALSHVVIAFPWKWTDHRMKILIFNQWWKELCIGCNFSAVQCVL